MEKPWYQSVTILSGIVFAAIQSAETLGVIPTGVTVELGKIVAALGALYGFRRAQG